MSALKRGTPVEVVDTIQMLMLFAVRCKIGSKLLLFIHGKSHTGFPWVSKLVTLNDLQRHNGRDFALFYRNGDSWGQLRNSCDM